MMLLWIHKHYNSIEWIYAKQVQYISHSWEVGQNRVQNWKNKTLFSDKWNYIYVSYMH